MIGATRLRLNVWHAQINPASAVPGSHALDAVVTMADIARRTTEGPDESRSLMMSRNVVPFNVGLVQMRCATDPVDNLSRAVEGVREAARRGAQVVCLPELFRTQYFCQTEDASNFDLAEPVPSGPTTQALALVAKETGVVVVGSVFERRTAGVYHNSAVVLDADGSLRGVYRKMHIPDDPLYYEKYYFTPGDLGFQTFGTKFAQVGTLVCWDQWYPEAARLTALKGAEVLFYPTAIGWHPSEKAEFGEAQAS